CMVRRNDAIDLGGVTGLAPRGIVISPGPGNPDSSGISLAIIRELSDRIPVLGVCLGHQAIGQVFGGKVIRAPRPKHGKISTIRHEGRGVFAGLPSPLRAARYHSLVVERESLPKCFEISAESEDGLIMGLRHRTLKLEGVQFHPESIATEKGHDMILN